MKRWTLLLGLSSIAVMGQVSNPSIILVTNAPSGACTAGLPNQQVATTGVQYSCQNNVWGSLGGGAASANFYPVVNVKNSGAKCDGVTDDTSSIQSALSTSGNIHVVIPYSPTSCVISDVLLLHSNTWLDVDPNTTIYEASGNNVIMLRNTNLAQVITDTNITVTGGIWDNNWVGNPGIQYLSTIYFLLRSSKSSPVVGASGTLGFYGVQYLTVRNVTVKDANIFSIQIAQCQDFHVSDITFLRTQATISDGIHVNGPSARFDIRNIYGAVGDDFIALNAWDWTISTPNNTEGDITDGYINVLRPNSSVWAVTKMSVGDNAGVYRVNLDDVKGQSTNAGFMWGTFPDSATPGHTTSTGTIGGIRASNAAINVTTASTSGSDAYGEVAFLAGNVQDVVFDGVVMDASHVPAPARPWMRIKAGMLINSLAMENFREDASAPLSYWIDNFGGINHLALKSGDIEGTPATWLASTLVHNETGGGVIYTESTAGGIQTFDSFNGVVNTALTSHTDNYGNAWTAYNSITGDPATTFQLSGLGAVGNVNTSTSVFAEALNAAVPATADYTVSGKCVAFSTGGGCVLYGRAASGANTSYVLYCDVGAGCQLYKCVTGSFTQIGTTAAGLLGDGVTHTMQLVMVGTSITAKLDGATISGVGGTDAAISAKGFGGMRMNGGGSMSAFTIQ